MANSVQLDRNGPDWPLGFVAVATPGTPVSIMTNIVNGGTWVTNSEYDIRMCQILFDAHKPNGSAGTVANTGNVYLVRVGVGAGLGNRTDYGSIIYTIPPGANSYFPLVAAVRNVYSPFRYYVDADNAGDGVQVTGFIL